MNSLVHNDAIARSLARAIARGHESLQSVPELLRRLVEEDMWQERLVPESAELVKFEHFIDFVETPPLDGLGTTIEVLKSLCQQDPKALALLDNLTENTPLSIPTEVDNGLRVSHVETSNSYLISRLERDGHQDTAQKVRTGELSPANAQREAGYSQRRIAIRLDDPESAARTLLGHMDPIVLTDLISLLRNR